MQCNVAAFKLTGYTNLIFEDGTYIIGSPSASSTTEQQERRTI
jgi:hypothetical protein